MTDQRTHTVCLTAANLLGKNPAGERVDDAVRLAHEIFDRVDGKQTPGAPAEAMSAKAVEEIEELSNEVAAANEKIAQLKAVIEQQMEQIVARNAKLVEMRNDMNALQKRAEEAEKEAREAKSEAQKQRGRADNLQAELDKLTAPEPAPMEHAGDEKVSQG